MDCIFCKIINKEIPSYTLYEDDVIKVFLDINPKSAGHTLITSKNHIKDLHDVDDTTIIYINNFIKKYCNTLTKLLKCDGYNIVSNLGCEQEVKHFHMHVIPKYKDSNSLNIEEVYNILKNDTNY